MFRRPPCRRNRPSAGGPARGRPRRRDLPGRRQARRRGPALHAARPVRRRRGRADHAAPRLAEERRGLRRAPRRVDRHAPRRPAGPRPLEAGTLVPLRGVDHRIVLDAAALRRCQRASARRAARSAPVAARRRPRSRRAALPRGRGAAGPRRGGAPATPRRSARPVARITLRDTRSRWGSCSSRGALNFSWRLILAPPTVLDYLAAHEVAHLVHMDHSERFWPVTRGLAPAMDEAEDWLKRHGPGLHRYGAAA